MSRKSHDVVGRHYVAPATKRAVCRKAVSFSEDKNHHGFYGRAVLAIIHLAACHGSTRAGMHTVVINSRNQIDRRTDTDGHRSVEHTIGTESKQTNKCVDADEQEESRAFVIMSLEKIRAARTPNTYMLSPSITETLASQRC